MWQEWFKLFAPSIATIVIGGIFVQRFFISHANQASYIDYLLEELNELRNDALKYWGTDITDENKIDMFQLSTQIKGRITALHSELNHLRHTSRFWLVDKFSNTNFSKKYKILQHPPEYLSTMSDVYDACTLGDFESEQHKCEKDRFFWICSTISKVRSDLIRMKI